MKAAKLINLLHKKRVSLVYSREIIKSVQEKSQRPIYVGRKKENRKLVGSIRYFDPTTLRVIGKKEYYFILMKLFLLKIFMRGEKK